MAFIELEVYSNKACTETSRVFIDSKNIIIESEKDNEANVYIIGFTCDPLKCVLPYNSVKQIIYVTE